MEDQMDKHFGSRGKGKRGVVVHSKAERAAWWLHLCFRIRLHAGKYHHNLPQQHTPPSSQSLYSLQHNQLFLL